jgi:hypothetical protein
MKIKNVLPILFLLISYSAISQNKTDISLFSRADSGVYKTEIFSESGDLYRAVGHHGPAVENEWMALRLYFDHKATIDVYNKVKPGLELKEAKWYPTPEQQKEGWGADYYKVGPTIGLGGVRLWDGEKVVKLDPVSGRYARVKKEGSISYMEMLSEGVPYKDTKVDILCRVTVYSGERYATVEAFALCDEPVQFVTGINYHEGQDVVVEDDCIISWGLHPEDVAAELVSLGAAIKYNPKDFTDKKDDGKQHLLISKPSKQLSWIIMSSSEKEDKLNTLEKLKKFMKSID